MRQLDRYMFQQIGLATLMGTVGLTFVVWLTQSLRFMDYLVNRGLPIADFVGLVGMLLPAFLMIVLPVATFISAMFVYNKLIGDNELIVMRAAGFSPLGLARPAILCGGIVSLVVYAISLYVMPIAYREFKDRQFALRHNLAAMVLREGTFQSVQRDVTLYIRERALDGALEGILIHDQRDPQRPVTLMAERGAFVVTDGGPRVVLLNGNRHEREAESGRLSLLYFDSYTLEIGEGNETLARTARTKEERFVDELLFPETITEEQRETLSAEQIAHIQKQRQTLIAEGHQRLIAPLGPLVFPLIALAALLSGDHNRRGQTRRVVAASLIVVAIQAGMLGFTNLAAKVPAAVVLIYLTMLVPLIGSLYVLVTNPRFSVSARLRLSGRAAARTA